MSMAYPLLAARLFGTPLLADGRKARVVAEALASRLAGGAEIRIADAGPAPDPRFRQAPPAVRLGPIDEAWLRESEPQPVLIEEASGIAYIGVKGTLVHKSGCLHSYSGELGYDGVGAQLDAAVEDPRVRGIMVDYHCAGGEAAGCFQLADRMAAARAVKPIVAVVDEMAFSAAYALASAASEVWLASDTAEVGSIGAVALHTDYSRALDQAGITVTVIRSGAHKADGNPFEKLPEAVKDRFTAELDYLRQRFVARVARYRDMPEDRLNDTEARTFMGPAAIEVGLADGIASPEEVFDRFAAALRRNPAAVSAA